MQTVAIVRTLKCAWHLCGGLLAVLVCLSANHLAAKEDLPAYTAQLEVSGIIRNYGNGYAGMLKKWEEGFKKYHPSIRFDDTLPTSDAAFPALITGVTDLAPNGSEPALTETLGFYEVYGYHPTAVTVASGSFDTEGRSPGIVVFVHEDNPLSSISIDQLDGIFGSERNGGLRGFKWTLEDGRGAEKDLRTWDQLIPDAAWRGQAINTYGHAPSGASRFFQHKILKNSNKWNPNYRGYVETGGKMIGDSDKETQFGGVRHMLAKELANDPFGIAWTIMPQAQAIVGIKPLALGRTADGPFIEPSLESFRNRTYPLVRSIYIYLNRKPGTAVPARLKEFLRYILSAEGQAVVADGSGFLPLPAASLEDERLKLE